MKSCLFCFCFFVVFECVCGACGVGYWGSGCQNACNSSTCFENKCNEASGMCEQCETGYWGDYCERSCSVNNCTEVSYCDKNHGSFCDKCEAGKWGYQCEKLCPPNCAVSCKLDTLKCNKGCIDGFWGDVCNLTCVSENCKACDQDTGSCLTCMSGSDGYWGEFCNKSCAIPDCAGPLLCNKDDGPTCFRCKTGKWGENCDNSCQDNCFGECSISDGECLVYGRGSTTRHSTSSESRSTRPPPHTLRRTDPGDQISRTEVFGIAFGAGALVCFIMLVVLLAIYRIYKMRTTVGFRKQENELSTENVSLEVGEHTGSRATPASSHSSVHFKPDQI